MAIEVLQNEEIFGGRKKKRGKGVGSAIRQSIANKKSINIKRRERGGVV